MVRRIYGGKVIGWNEKEEVETPTRETHIYKDGKLHRIIKSDTPMLDENQSPAPGLTEKEKRQSIDEGRRYLIKEEKLEKEKTKELLKQERQFQKNRLYEFFLTKWLNLWVKNIQAIL